MLPTKKLVRWFKKISEVPILITWKPKQDGLSFILVLCETLDMIIPTELDRILYFDKSYKTFPIIFPIFIILCENRDVFFNDNLQKSDYSHDLQKFILILYLNCYFKLKWNDEHTLYQQDYSSIQIEHCPEKMFLV